MEKISLLSTISKSKLRHKYLIIKERIIRECTDDGLKLHNIISDSRPILWNPVRLGMDPFKLHTRRYEGIWPFLRDTCATVLIQGVMRFNRLFRERNFKIFLLIRRRGIHLRDEFVYLRVEFRSSRYVTRIGRDLYIMNIFLKFSYFSMFFLPIKSSVSLLVFFFF